MKKKGTFHLPTSPGRAFTILFLLLILASYFPFPPLARGLLASLAFAGALFLALRKAPLERPVLEPRPEGPSSWPWLLVIVLLLFTRFSNLTTLPFWPIGDEGILSSLAMDQAKSWRWDLLVAEDRQEALGVWLLAWFFKVFEPSLFSIRLFPALISLVTCAAAYWAARQFYSRSTAFLVACFLAFSFWEFTFSRSCMRIILLVLIQCVCFGLLGLCLKRSGEKPPWGAVLGLGVAGGIGFYTFTSWAGVWLGLAACLALEGRKSRSSLIVFLLVSGLLGIPMGLARLAPGGLSYIQENIAGGWPGLSFLPYLQQVLWDGTRSYPFGSDWGGLFNPLAGALVLTGAWTSFRRSSSKTRWSFGLCLFFAALPAAISRGIELHRLAAGFPLLTLLAALGAKELASLRSRSSYGRIALGLLSVSFLLDAYNFVARYSQPSFAPPGQQWRSEEYHQAYGILKAQASPEHPILFFSEFNTDYDDKTLVVAVHPFDALQQPRLQEKCRTAVLLLHQDYAPFLQKDFPGSMIHSLSGTTQGRSRSLLLAFLPISSFPSRRLEAWMRADGVYRWVHRSMRDRKRSEPWGRFSRPILDMETYTGGDRLMGSVFWEKLAFFSVLDGDFPSAARSYRMAIDHGYPAGHLFRNLGRALELSGRPQEAQEAFRKGEAIGR